MCLSRTGKDGFQLLCLNGRFSKIPSHICMYSRLKSYVLRRMAIYVASITFFLYMLCSKLTIYIIISQIYTYDQLATYTYVFIVATYSIIICMMEQSI